MRARLALPLAALALALAAPSARATFVIVNMDSAGVGLNDTTAAVPVGGNPGTTVGQQRLNVFVEAGQIWDAILQSPVPIRVEASFASLPCAPTSGVLGSAGPYYAQMNFANAPYPNTWFVGAEVNRLAGSDLQPTLDDIAAQFNSDVGLPSCLSSRSWYYGFDDNPGPSGIDLLVVVLHEMGHGLGFLTLTDETNGAYYYSNPTIFDRYLMDDVSGKHWIDMTPSERVASAINTNHLVWDGPAVTTWAPRFMGPRAHVVASGAITGDFTAGFADFGAPLTSAGVTGTVARVLDGVGTTTDGCDTPFLTPVAGKVAIVDRSTACSFAQKALNAQAAGAIALLVVNNTTGSPPGMSGIAPAVTIPVASLSQSDGAAIDSAATHGTVTVTIGLDPARLAGTDSTGRMLMFAPNPDQPGSSVSHWDISAHPNLLMEPAINSDLTAQVDLTYATFVDIGWFPQLAAAPAPKQAGEAFALSSGPNPASGGGTLRFALPAAGRAELAIFDVAGRRVSTLVDGPLTAGEHSVEWRRTDDTGRRVGSGVYLARLREGAWVRTLHIVIVD